MFSCCHNYISTAKSAIFRRKEVKSKEIAFETKLKRCLNIFDVVLLGISATMSSGMYVLTGQIAKNITGPSAIISYLIAGFVAINIALCYAEFSSRIPWAGSGYAYAYITIGEIWAFLVGWNVLLENTMGLATVGITWGNYMDSMLGGYVANNIEMLTGRIDNPIISSSPNILAICILMFLTFLLVCGVKSSTMVNNVFCMINLISIAVIVIYGGINADVTNWTNAEHGGFMPYGLTGVMNGAGVALFGYIGFEVIASTAEEMKDPCRNIPKTLMITVLIVNVSYFSVCAVLTLDLPYYELSEKTSVIDTFSKLNYPWVRRFVTIGALAAMTSGAFGSIYASSRAAYAMAVDGMLPKVFGHVTNVSKSPIFSTIFFGVVGSILAGFCKLSVLIELVSIGCLFAFSIVSASLIVLRYTPSSKIPLPAMYEQNSASGSLKYSGISNEPNSTGSSSSRELQNVFDGTGLLKSRYARMSLTWPFNIEPGVLIPLVPLLPTISLCLNVVLMVSLSGATWLRFVIWILIGLALYFGYGIKQTSSYRNLKPNPESNRLVEHSDRSIRYLWCDQSTLPSNGCQHGSTSLK
ncbi:Cationic amino acid transporter 2 [Nymphon striatum]|nr:Cationic amino acid transporter 2 [Nymphon striatum]